MKHTILIAFALLGLTGSFRAQSNFDEASRKPDILQHQMLFSPFYFFGGTFMMSYEYLTLSHNAFRITPSVTLNNSGNNYESREGVGLDLGYKISVFNKYKANVYMGPYFMYKYAKHSSRDYYYNVTDNKTYNVLGLGIDAGIKLTFGRFVMDITLGGGARYPLQDYSGYSSRSIFHVAYKGIAPRANFFLGIAL